MNNPYLRAQQRQRQLRPMRIMTIAGTVLALAVCAAIIVVALVVVGHFVVKFW